MYREKGQSSCCHHGWYTIFPLWVVDATSRPWTSLSNVRLAEGSAPSSVTESTNTDIVMLPVHAPDEPTAMPTVPAGPEYWWTSCTGVSMAKALASRSVKVPK